MTPIKNIGMQQDCSTVLDGYKSPNPTVERVVKAQYINLTATFQELSPSKLNFIIKLGKSSV